MKKIISKIFNFIFYDFKEHCKVFGKRQTIAIYSLMAVAIIIAIIGVNLIKSFAPVLIGISLFISVAVLIYVIYRLKEEEHDI